MKFLKKINRNYFILLLSTLLLTTVVGYFVIQIILLNNAKERLFMKKEIVKEQIIKTGELPNLYPLIDIKEIPQITISKPYYQKIWILNKSEHEMEPFLEYVDQFKLENSLYELRMRQSLFESDDLRTLLVSFIGLILLMTLGIAYFVSRYWNKYIWRDFEHNLREMERYSFNIQDKLKLSYSSIDEFDRLNLTVEKLTERLNTEYTILKEFSENASHEIQTPLSIALLNLDELLQFNIDEQTFHKINITINALKRLSALNQHLILLNKIENNQFGLTEQVSFKDLTISRLEEFAVLMEAKDIAVETNFDDDFSPNINRQLAGILINNLISNAIKHNVEGGKIFIKTDKNSFEISNTGNVAELGNDNIFLRFTKSNSASYGLGLAIVKSICEMNKLDILYTKNDLHCFYIKYKNE